MAYFPKGYKELHVPAKLTCNLNLGIQFGDIISSLVTSTYNNIKKKQKKSMNIVQALVFIESTFVLTEFAV